MFACAKVAPLLERRAVGLTESERLLAESHLADCPRCRELSKLLEGTRRASAPAIEGVLDSSARELVMRRAFETAARTIGPSARRRAGWLRPALAAAAALMATTLGVLLLLAPASVLVTERADTLVSGSLSTDRGRLGAGAPIPSNVALSIQSPTQLRVGNARVALTAGSTVRWLAARETLSLESGAVDVNVTHEPGKKFFVATESFIVEVVGTQFHVDKNGVSVQHGTVRVLSQPARDVLAVLPAGGVWSAPAARVSATEPAPPADVRAAAEEPEKARAVIVETVAQRLTVARRALADGRIAEAERLVEGALGGRVSTRELAEGRTLLAECAVARGQNQRAAQLYLGVAKAFPALPAGENALFAGARLSERFASAERARALFEDYLRRYPKGRFRTEAERHLQRPTTLR